MGKEEEESIHQKRQRMFLWFRGGKWAIVGAGHCAVGRRKLIGLVCATFAALKGDGRPIEGGSMPHPIGAAHGPNGP